MKKSCSFFSIWPIYLLIVVVIGTIFPWAVDFKTSPSKEQIIDFCFAVNTLDTGSFKDRIKTQNSEFDIKEVNVQRIVPNTVDFDRLYLAIEENVDFYVLPLGVFELNFEKYFRNFATLDQENITNNLGNIDTYSYNEKIYGIKIYDEKLDIGFGTDLISYKSVNVEKKDYFIFLNKNSLHKEVTKITASLYDVIKSFNNEKEAH